MLSDIKHKFQLVIEGNVTLFDAVEKKNISYLLNEILKENIPLALAIHTEKARSEMIIAPILIELRKMFNHKISLFSGIEFNVDKEKGLNGICDYIISLSKEQFYVNAPVILKSGLAQCAAEMLAARIFNEQQGNQIHTIYGIVTTGSNWRFLKLNKHLLIENYDHYIEPIGKIMGILSTIMVDSVIDKTV